MTPNVTTEIRLALQANGYSPVPCIGKRPAIPEWQHKTDVSPYDVARWPGLNTGVLTAYTPGADIDIMHPEAAELAEDVAKELFGDRGKMPVRFGQLPKRTLPFRTATPFPKMSAAFEAPNGMQHKIEILGDGQQFIAFGTHPDTKEPFTWHGGTPLDTPHEELAEVTEQDMRTYLGLVSERLADEFGFRRIHIDGHDGGAGGGPVDVDERLAAMRFGGARDNAIHPTQLHVTASLLRNGLSFDETVLSVLAATKEAVAGDARTKEWDWNEEGLTLARMAASFISKNPELAHCLPEELRETFERKREEGREPYLVYRKGTGWWVGSKSGAGDNRLRRLAKETGAAEQAAAETVSHTIAARPFIRFDPTTLPAREWLYGGHYQRGIITATVGPGGGGKSSLNLVELIAICTGRPLLGEQPVLRCRAWYHNAEDGMEEIYRRLAAVCQHYQLDQSELEGWLFVTSGIDMPIKIASTKGGVVQIDKPTAAAIIRTIADNEIGIASFDPLVAHHAATENVTGDMDQVIREFARIANATECAIEIVHHTRKPAPGQEELGVIDSRGAGAIINAVRSARVLNTMSKAEADSAGVDDVDRRLHFRIDRGKANMAPPTAARWHKFVGIELPNGDDVGVATHWVFPGQGAGTEEMAEAERKADELFMSLLVRFTMEGRKVSPNTGPAYAPVIFAKEREAKAALIGKSALADAMRRLFEVKRIRAEQAGGKGHYTTRIVVNIRNDPAQ